MLFNSVEQLNDEQKHVYNTALVQMSNPANQQLIMFISGESGTGKSKLARIMSRGAEFLFNSYKEHEEKGLFGPVLRTAPTGSGAFRIGGFVWRHVLEKTAQYYPKVLTPIVIDRLQSRLKGIKVFVLDELNLVSLEDLYEINHRLCTATGDFSKPFGGLHVLMFGDLYQMRAITGTPIVKVVDCCMSNSRAMQGRLLFTDVMTHYACLTVNHRVSGVLGPLADFVRAARLGVVSQLALEQMNTRVVESLDVAMRNAHPKAMWICDSYNRVDHINQSFLDKLGSELGKQVIRLVAYHRPASCVVKSGYLDLSTKDRLRCINGGSRLDRSDSRPLLAPLVIKICVGSRVRLTANLLPSIGLYNGAMGTVMGLVYKGAGQNTSLLQTCHSDDEQELPIVLVRIDGNDNSFPCSCIRAVSRVVPIVPIASPQRIDVEGRRFIRYQVPIALAHARTTHALSGYTANHGIVGDVGGAFFAGQYVALSRTTSVEQMQLLAPLKQAHFTGHPDFRHSVDVEYSRLSLLFSAKTLGRLHTAEHE